MSQVFVELRRVNGAPNTSEFVGVFLDESEGDLSRGNVIAIDSEPGKEWAIHSVHRCVERHDGTTDHSRCWL